MEAKAQVQQLATLNSKMRAIRHQKRLLIEQLGSLLPLDTTMKIGNYKVRNTVVVSKTISVAKLEKQYPTAYLDLVTFSGSRRIRIEECL